MQASEFFEIVRVPLKSSTKICCFPLLLALHTLVTLFSFQGAKLRKLFRGEAASEVFFAYFLVHKKVSGGLERTRTSDLTLIRRAL